MGVVIFHKILESIEYHDFISLIMFSADLARQKIIIHTRQIIYVYYLSIRLIVTALDSLLLKQQ